VRAVGYFAPGPITAPNSLLDIELPRPSATGRDLLVEVRAVSVNPVDYKVRASVAPPAETARRLRSSGQATRSSTRVASS
jgi:NADPH:quinone reductase